MPQPKGKTITYEDTQGLFGEIPLPELRATESFIAGDHWQKQDGWIGWRPESGSKTASEDWLFIQRSFTAKNVIKSIVKRIRGAVLGKEPDWQIVSLKELRDGQRSLKPLPAPVAEGQSAPTPKPPEPTPEQKEWRDVDDIMTDWWTAKGIHSSLKRFVQNYAAYGKASLRIYVPSGYITSQENGTATLNIQSKSDLAEVLSKIYVEAPHYSNVINQRDLEFGEDYVALGLPADDMTREQPFEVHYIDIDGTTHIRPVKQHAESVGEIVIDLGGNLLTCVKGEFQDALISEPVKQQQRQVNHAKTMEGYALANINFPEKTFINADFETEQVTDEHGVKSEVVKPLKSGLGRFVSLIGVLMQRGDGGETYATPDVKYREAADPEKFSKVAENNTRDMHQEASMLYVLLANSPYPSGESRVEAMTDYLILLVDYKTLIDTVGVWLLETVLRLAFNFTGATEKNSEFAVLFSSKLTIGRMSAKDKEVMLQEVAANLRSKRNYMITAEITDDPEMEWEAIAAEPVTPLPDPNKARPVKKDEK